MSSPSAPPPDEVVPLRRLVRERDARKAAESLLMEKSRELFLALQSSRDAERRLQLALWGSGEGVWEWTAAEGLLRIAQFAIEGHVPTFRPRALAQWLRYVHPDDRAAFVLACRGRAAHGSSELHVTLRVEVGSQWRWIRARGRAFLSDPAGRPIGVYGTIKDVTDQRAADHALHLLAEAFASTLDALVVVDGGGQILQSNSSFHQLGGAPAKVKGARLADFVALPPLDVTTRTAWVGETTFRRRDGSAVPVEVSITAVVESAGQNRCHIVVLRDISERVRQAVALRRLALEDPLTGLPNRSALEAEVAARLLRHEAFALLFLDLDGFKGVNDGFGHEAGDAILRHVGRRLTAAFAGLFICRWGGDEFIVLAPPEPSMLDLPALAQRIRQEVGTPCGFETQWLRVTPSIGAVTSPRDGGDLSTLIRRADAAMYAAKAAGQDQLVIFTPVLEVGTQRRSQLQVCLRQDVEAEAFDYVLQPKVNGHRQAVGAELLLRWHPPAFGPISPAEFIPIAEQIGVIDRLGRFALQAAARAARSINGAIPIAVNLSPRQLLRSDLEAVMLEVCASERCDPTWLELELTESALITDIGVVQGLLMRLRDHGFGLALDDFGTGYSALSHLRTLPFQKVKIDRSFVQDLTQSANSRVILAGITHLCNSIGMATVAEGVETAEQFAVLRALGIDEFQGFYFAKPMAMAAWQRTVTSPFGPLTVVPSSAPKPIRSLPWDVAAERDAIGAIGARGAELAGGYRGAHPRGAVALGGHESTG
jgi:diguanylate cyclase (GGDEF)-like protein/PAS domain S-box-containing protein